MASNYTEVDIKIMIANIDQGSGSNEKTEKSEQEREKIISKFLTTKLEQKPDIVLFQEVKDTLWRQERNSQNTNLIKQSEYCRIALGKSFNEIKELEKNDDNTKGLLVNQKSYNSIVYNERDIQARRKSEIWPRDKLVSVKLDADFKLDTSRFCVGEFSVKVSISLTFYECFFLTIVLCSAFLYFQFGFVIFGHKMLMILTERVNFNNILRADFLH